MDDTNANNEYNLANKFGIYEDLSRWFSCPEKTAGMHSVY